MSRILSASAVGGQDEYDLAEELYGHLVERWSDAVANGADPTTAAEQAIEAFGQPQVVGPQMTAAFHSRLYASTIGVLLPIGLGSGEDVNGYGRAVLVLGIGFVAELALGLLSAVLLGPLSAMVVIATCLYLAGLSVLAIKALGRGLPWAVAFVQLTCVIDLIATLLGALVFGAPTFLGVAIGAAFDVWVIAGTQVPWKGPAESGWLRRNLIPFIAVSTIAVYGLQLGAFVIPDPTQTKATDLQMTVTASCPSTGPWSVTAQLTWARTDPLGGRLIPMLRDGVGLSIGRDDGTAPGFPGDTMPAFDEDVTGGDIVDLSTGATIHSELNAGNEWSMPSGFNTGNRSFAIDPSWMHAGATYTTTFQMAGAEADKDAIWGGRDRRFRVRYDHLERWGLEAVVTCGGTVEASPVTLR